MINTKIKSKIIGLKKIVRFFSIYGFSRTITKVLGRFRINAGPFTKSNGEKSVAVVGCGQFAFSTICYFLKKQKNIKFYSCYDIDINKSKSLGRRYGFIHVADSFEQLLEFDKLHTVYIASNHYSHTEYAIKTLEKGINVYIEKPISVNKNQLCSLLSAITKSTGSIYAGYNRPFSQPITDLKELLNKRGCIQNDTPFTVNCFISGHVILPDHWYMIPKEGTRICGNLGHWIDLIVHLLSWREQLPDNVSIQITYSDKNVADDNIAVAMTTDKHDLLTITFSSRTEPFEGINETINIQCGKAIAKIDDFRTMTVWIDDLIGKKRYFPKDVGHKNAIRQPFATEKRNWHEVEISTLLMLYIRDMALNREASNYFSIQDAKKIILQMRAGIYKLN
jgi:predicted dehydrogenase